MVLPLLFLCLLSSFSSIAYSQSGLSLDYYAKTCPQFDSIVLEAVQKKQSAKAETAAATLRVFFHDCMVDGCDASVLIRSNAFNKAERDSDLNLSLGSDAFDLVNEIKVQLENKCPGVVSCADILAFATKVLVTTVGGPHYKVPLGRKDGLVSQATRVEGHLAKSNMSMDQMISIFQAHGFNIQEMVALVGGGHTIGFVHCSEIAHRIFGATPDPTIHPFLAKRLQETCNGYQANQGKSAFLDIMRPGVFDNTIFRNIERSLAVLGSDQALLADPRTKPFVEKYSKDQEFFFKDFAQAMEKVGQVGVKTGNNGEIRRRCDAFNNAN